MSDITVDPQPKPLVTEPVSVSTYPHNFSKSILIGILVFVLLSATAYGTYWYTKNYLAIVPSQPTVSSVQSELTQPKNPLSNISNQSTPAATTDETAGWKTYTDSVHSVSMRYPPDWEYVKSHPSGQNGCLISNDQSGTDEGIGGGYNIQRGSVVCISELGNAKGENYHNVICNSKGDVTGKGSSTCNLITLNNNLAIQREERYQYPIGDFSKGYIRTFINFEQKNLGLYLLYKQSTKQIIDQILSTLKFL